MKYTLKNVKFHEEMSEETNCFSATIYCYGKKIGTVQNSGTGGSHEYRFEHQADWKALDKYAKQQPHEYNFEVTDQYIDKLLVEWDINRQLKRWCKSATLFRLKGDKPEAWRTVKHAFNEQVRQFITAKYGDQLEEIANERVAA